MKCPLILMAWLHKTGTVPTTQADCFKEECAWWAHGNERCVIFDIGCHIYSIAEFLEDIKDDMPK